MYVHCVMKHLNRTKWVLNTKVINKYSNTLDSLIYLPHLHSLNDNVKLTKLFSTLCSRDKQDRTSSCWWLDQQMVCK